MYEKIYISIPIPCHENWQTMNLVEKGRFCTSCQKNVIDFSKASDNEIIESVNKNNNLCGRFSISQLNRAIEKPSSKKKKWLALATLTSFLSFASQEVFAQGEPYKTIQTDKEDTSTQKSNILNQVKKINGLVSDELGPLAGANISIIGTNKYTTSNFDGEFSIEAHLGDKIIVTYVGFKNYEEVISVKNEYSIKMTESSLENQEVIIAGGYCVRRTFFGRQIQKIRNWFR